MTFRRGFKTDAIGIAKEIRAEMKLGPMDRLIPSDLASLLEIPIICLTDLAKESPAIDHLVTVEPEAFSAATVFRGARRTIVHNDGHSAPRQSSNLAHELAHGLLLHPPSAALDNRGSRNWNQQIEDEASWLSGVLLVTEEATIAIARGQISLRDASWALGVSVKMVRFRVNATGAMKRVQRARDYR